MSDSVLQKFLAEMPDLPEFTGISAVGVHTRGGWQSTPLHIAAVRGDVAAIAALLDAGADIQSRGEHGYMGIDGLSFINHYPIQVKQSESVAGKGAASQNPLQLLERTG
jgi:Ankyrin repeat